MVHNCKVEGKWYMVLHLHKKQKNVVCKSIQPPESILCWTTFRCNDSCKSFWVSLYQRCTCKIAQALPEILKLIWSGLWLGHSNTWICFDLNHSIVALAVCLGLLSCWKVNLRPSLKFFADSHRLSKLVLYLAPSLFPSTQTSFPVPAEEKHPHSMMLPWHKIPIKYIYICG